MLRRRLRDDEGVSSVELAVIAPSLVLLIFFIIQVALYLYGRSVALQAAREGVTQLRLDQTVQQYDGDKKTVSDNVTQFATNIGSGALNDPSAIPTYDDQAGTVTVIVTGKAISLVPFLDLSISETATGRIERFENAP